MDKNTTFPEVKSKCETCIHYLKDKKCPAFWEDIPEDIWSGKAEHDTVRKDQLLDIIYKKRGGLI